MATTVTFDVYAKDKASGTFVKVGNAAEKTEPHVSKLGGALKKVALGFGAFEAGKSAIEFLKGSTEAAAANQAAQAHLALALRNTTHASGEQIKVADEWITKQSLATGVAKTDLQPALQHLAESTGSVSKAQKELHLAMDVSAGTGRSLSSVTLALVKANNGSLGGLSRFGIKTQQVTQVQGKAVTSTISLHKAVTEMGKQFGGQAKAQAQTFQGQMSRLNAQWEEAKVKIGNKLIPILTKLGDWFFRKGAPAAAEFAKVLEQKMGPIVDKVKSAFEHIEPVLVRVGNFMKKNPDTVKAFAITLGILAAAIGAVTAATAAWDAVLDANPVVLVAVAIAGLVAGLVYAYEHSQKFAAVVKESMHVAEVAFHGVVNVAHVVIGLFTGGSWGKLGAVLAAPFKIGAHLISAAWNGIKRAVSGGVGSVVDITGSIISKVRAVLDPIIAVYTWPYRMAFRATKDLLTGNTQDIQKIFGALPGKIKAALGDLSHLLYSAGQAVIKGLVDGISSMFGAVKSKLGDLTHSLTSWKGPPEKDRILLKPAGVMLMEGLVSGIQQGSVLVQKALGQVTSAVQAAGQKLKTALGDRDSFAAGFQSFSTSVFGADYGTDANGNPNAPTTHSILAFQKAQAKQAHLVKRDTRKLVHMGLSPALLKQLQSEGAAGMQEIQALAASSPEQIRRLNRLNKETSSDLHSAGMTAGNRIYGEQIKQDRKHYSDEQKLLKEIRDLLKQGHGQVASFEIRGDTLVAILKKHKRTTGSSA